MNKGKPHESGFEIIEVTAGQRPRRLSNLGIDFLDDPDQRPEHESASYHPHHAESYWGDKEHRSEDLEQRFKK